jgi:hypothetical protein
MSISERTMLKMSVFLQITLAAQVFLIILKLSNQVCGIRQLVVERAAGYVEKNSRDMKSGLPPPLCPLITQHNTNTARLQG